MTAKRRLNQQRERLWRMAVFFPYGYPLTKYKLTCILMVLVVTYWADFVQGKDRKWTEKLF